MSPPPCRKKLYADVSFPAYAKKLRRCTAHFQDYWDPRHVFKAFMPGLSKTIHPAFFPVYDI